MQILVDAKGLAMFCAEQISEVFGRRNPVLRKCSKGCGLFGKRIPCQAELQLALNVLSVPAVNRNLSREATEAVNHWLAGVAGTDGKDDESILTIDRFSCQLHGEKMDFAGRCERI